MKTDHSSAKWRLRKNMAKCTQSFNLIEDGDKVMVAISGGKDSYALLYLLREMQRRVPFSFEILAVHLDQGQPGYDGKPMVDWLVKEGFDYKILRQDTYSVVMDKIPEGKTYCSLCSRLRRGILYNAAVELGCSKIALGHHRDDLLETFLLNFFFAGQMKTMPPKLLSDDGRNVVIRPLAFCKEADLQAFSDEMEFPILPCNLCGSQDNLRRQSMKTMLKDLENRWPDCTNYVFRALSNVRPSHLLDEDLWRNLDLEVAQTLPEGVAKQGFPSDTPSRGKGTFARLDTPKAIPESIMQDELGF